MPLIDNTTLIGIADRCAMQYQLLKFTVEQIAQAGGGLYHTRVNGTGDVDVQIPLLSRYLTVDESWSIDTVMLQLRNLTAVVEGMDAHFNRVGFGGSWDGYCQTHDLLVSDHFNQVHKLSKQGFMLSRNVFSEEDDVFGTIEVAAGPALDFTDGEDYGNGAATNRATGTNFAPVQLRVVVDSMGATDLDLRLNVKDSQNDPVTIDVTIPASTSVGASIDVGTGSDLFLDVTGVSFNGSQGTVGDAVRVLNKKPRQIAL